MKRKSKELTKEQRKAGRDSDRARAKTTSVGHLSRGESCEKTEDSKPIPSWPHSSSVSM